MRIGLLTDSYKPVVNGITNFVALHKKQLEARGHKPFVFTLGHVDYEDEEVRVIRSEAVPLSDTGYYISFTYNRRARRKLPTMDIFHVQHPFLAGRIAMGYRRRYGIPLVYTNHTRYDLLAQHYVPLLPDNLSQLFLDAYLPYFTSQCDLVIAPCNSIRDLLVERFGVTARIKVIPNGIDLKPFQQPTTSRTRAELGLPEQAKVAIFVGRIAWEKNLFFLLQAFASIHSQVPDLYLLLVGGGPETKQLQELAHQLGVADRVIFVGQVPYEDVPGYLKMADAFVTASVTEVHPLSVIEAVAAGLPVVGIRSPGVADTVIDGVHGFLTRLDLAEFGLRLVELMNNDALRAEMSARALADSRQYAIEHTSQRILDCYEEILREETRQERRSRLSTLKEKVVKPLEDLVARMPEVAGRYDWGRGSQS